MLPKKLNEIKVYLESKNGLDEDEKEFLNELKFINENISIQTELKNKYKDNKLFESFALAPGLCPTCGKRL